MGKGFTVRNVLFIVVFVTCLLFLFYLGHVSYTPSIVSYHPLRQLIGKTESLQERIVVISLTVRKGINLSYAFAIPLVVAAWDRINWKVVVIVVGDIDVFWREPVYDLIRTTSSTLVPHVQFITVPVRHNPVSYSQVIRLFAVMLMPWLNDQDILMTSDIDIVPINETFYNHQIRAGITIYNADCCGSFPWNKQNVAMQPITSILMTAQDWCQVMELECPNKDFIISYIDKWLMQYYGSGIKRKDVTKGGNADWYMDQRVISIQIHKSTLSKHKVPRNTKAERVDRVYLSSWSNYTYRTDAHLFLPSYPKQSWNYTTDLLRAVFKSTRIVSELETYRKRFVYILN